MSGVTRQDRIRNEYGSGSIGVTSIVDKMNRGTDCETVWACVEERENGSTKRAF